MLKGPAHSPSETTCLDCGSQFNREVRTIPKPEAVRSQLPEFPAEGFDTPEAAMAHLAKLKEAAKALGKPTVGTEDRINKPKRKVHPTSDYPVELVMAELHYYQRKGEGFPQVLSTAKGERGVRNENVLIFVHNHHPDQSCTNSCREVIENG
jgi:hypothetical protein